MTLNGKPKIIDLFSGAGGFSLGAHQAGFHSIAAVDIDNDLTVSFTHNFPLTNLILKDIYDLSPSDILKTNGIKKGEIDAVISGPPCQGFSLIGRRRPEDGRNRLISRFFNVMLEIEPKFFIMENVPGILSSFGRDLLNEGLDIVGGRYNIIGPIILDAADYGAATERRRTFVFGYRPEYVDRVSEDDLHVAKSKPVTVREAIGDLPKLQSGRRSKGGQYWAKYRKNDKSDEFGSYSFNARKEPPDGLGNESIRAAHAKGEISGYQPTAHTQKVVERFANVKPGKTDRVSRCPRLSWGKPCKTLRAGTGKDRGSYQSIRPIHPKENRVITVREAARIQGFPDWFQFHTTKWHSFRMIGNSVSPILAEAILRLFSSRIGANQ